MRKTTYRMCLLAVIVLAATFGIWYYAYFEKTEPHLSEGTFVKQMEQCCRKTFSL